MYWLKLWLQSLIAISLEPSAIRKKDFSMGIKIKESRGDRFNLHNSEGAFVLAVKVIFVIKRWGVLPPYLTNKQWGQRPRILSLTVIIALGNWSNVFCLNVSVKVLRSLRGRNSITERAATPSWPASKQELLPGPRTGSFLSRAGRISNYKNNRKSLWKINLPRISRSLCLRLSMIRPKKGRRPNSNQGEIPPESVEP